MNEDNQKIKGKEQVVCREEFDDWAILFDPDNGQTFGLNPTSVFVWKCLDGNSTPKEIVQKLKESCENVSEEAEAHVKDFIKELVEKGLASVN